MTTGDRPSVGVGAVVIRDGAILLVQRAHEPGKGLWAVPGGKVRWGETMRAAVAREVLEETGLEISVGDVVWTGEVITDDVHLVLLDFEAQVIGGHLQAGDDAAQAVWVDLETAREMPLTGTMYDLLDTLAP